MSSFIQLQITYPSRAGAKEMANQFVECGYCACAQIVGPIESVYIWEGKVKTDREWLLLAKTRAEHFNRISQLVTDSHPYECPQIVAVPLEHISNGYQAWLNKETLTIKNDQ